MCDVACDKATRLIVCSFVLIVIFDAKFGQHTLFFLEYVEELRINILRRKKRERSPECYRYKGSVTLSGVGPKPSEPWVWGPCVLVCRADRWWTCGCEACMCPCVKPITGGLLVLDPVIAKGHQCVTGEIVGIVPHWLWGRVEPN